MYTCECFVFCSKLVKYDIVVGFLMNSWLIGVVVDIRYCCWWFILWVFVIMEFVVKFDLFLKVLWKMGELVIFYGMMFFIQVLYGFGCLFMSINVWTNIGNEFRCWGIKNGVLEWKWSFFSRAELMNSVTTRHGELMASWRRVVSVSTRHGEWNGGHGELLSTSTHIFVVLGFWGRSGPFQTDSFDVMKCN